MRFLAGCALGASLLALNPAPISAHPGQSAIQTPTLADHKQPLIPTSAEETRGVRERFRQALAYSYMPSRSGHLFVLPRKYFPVMFESGNYAHDGHSFIKGQKVPHEGATHGMIWDYDTHIPLLLYGPGLIKTSQRLSTPATQQDLVPTYARLMGAVPPQGAVHGRVLTEALRPDPVKPKAILTIVIDQGGWQYYQAHPDKTPYTRALMQRGSLYTEARIKHVDVETFVGHAAIGTGAYPYQHGIISNRFYNQAFGARISPLSPDTSGIFLNSPSLADVWGQQTANQAHVISYAYADRAAIGMAGHGAMYARRDKKDIVLWYSNRSGQLETNEKYYRLPDYLRGMHIKPYLQQLLAQDPQGKWFGHGVNNLRDVNRTPAQAAFDGDVLMKLLAREPIGQDDITDLVYVTLKASDACGHSFGFESDECGSVFAMQDQQIRRIVEAFEKKVGQDQMLVVLTADHGASPLTTLSGGSGISAEVLKAAMNKAFDKLDNDVELVYDMLASQIFVDENEMQRNGVSWEQLKAFLRDYQVDGHQAFLDVYSRRDVTQFQLEQNLIP
ncbi:MAG: alkaline phosphatase family protein [Candidatus Sericytochromatia bacterium]|nr:alkaline phosphatase family protein [Candidatus Sericytochromatia bacterium]